jgi:hypothetical protein
MSLESCCIALGWMYSASCDYVLLVSSRVLTGVVVCLYILVVYYYG